MPKKKIRLNLGCGSNKIDGFVNIDGEASCKPDLVCNFTNKLPYKTGSVEEVILFHTIEHINKVHHERLLREIYRVLRPGGSFMVSYPEFTTCVNNWMKNHKGTKSYWEATIFGRGLYLLDFHVCIMHTPDFIPVLEEHGFTNIVHKKEPPPNEFNTIVSCEKGVAIPTYEDLVQRDIDSLRVNKIYPLRIGKS